MTKLEYFDHVQDILKRVRVVEADHIEAATQELLRCICSHGSIYIFGASHAGILSEEMFYRAGGLMLINPIFGEEVSVQASPITLTSDMERLVGYGSILAKHRAAFKKGDVLIAHSVSGRNPVTVEIALAAKEADTHVIALTNLSYSRGVTSRHPSGKRLFEVADIVIDNHGDVGDATVQIEGMQQKVGPTSTVVGATILNAIVVEAVQRMVDKGITTPPVFYSANLDGGDQLNRRLYQEYKNSIKYQF